MDANENSKQASEQAQVLGEQVSKGADKVSEGAKDMSAALLLTPKIKAAFLANPFLNENGNRIDVDSTPETVTLTGHVKTAKNKVLAEDLAKKVLSDSHSTSRLQNNLSVNP